MSNRINLAQTEKLLRDADNIIILTHRYPDGDTLGSAYALCRILRELHKTAHVLCPDPIPPKYDYLREGIDDADNNRIKNANFIVAVDIAAPLLLGGLESEYSEIIDLCIDHHGSNSFYAKHTLLDTSAAAAGEIIYNLWREMRQEQSEFNHDLIKIAECIFTAITTDTGCFRYCNVTPVTHGIAAHLLKTGIDGAAINRAMFESKSRARMRVEQMVLSTLRFYDDTIAVISLSKKAVEESGAGEGDLDGLASIPRRIEGIKTGMFLRESDDGWKISLRTAPGVDASKICGRLGGGGHPAAAGATLQCGLDETLDKVLEAIRME